MPWYAWVSGELFENQPVFVILSLLDKLGDFPISISGLVLLNVASIFIAVIRAGERLALAGITEALLQCCCLLTVIFWPGGLRTVNICWQTAPGR